MPPQRSTLRRKIRATYKIHIRIPEHARLIMMRSRVAAISASLGCSLGRSLGCSLGRSNCEHSGGHAGGRSVFSWCSRLAPSSFWVCSQCRLMQKQGARASGRECGRSAARSNRGVGQRTAMSASVSIIVISMSMLSSMSMHLFM